MNRAFTSSFLDRIIAVSTTPTVAGLAVRAKDTGRVLMLQRSYKDLTDPARGKFEYPGGHAEPDESLQDAAIREWEEETGSKLIPGTFTGEWTSPNGVYRGYVYEVPHEADVIIQAPGGRRVPNPDDPTGDDAESVAWFKPSELKHNPSVRREVRESTDWSLFTDRHEKAHFSPGAYLVDRIVAQADGPKDISPISTSPTTDTGMPGERYATSNITVHPSEKKLKVSVADSPSLRSVGVQNDADTGNGKFDPMLFVWPSDTRATMSNHAVNKPVNCHVFDSSGMWRDQFLMAPNQREPMQPNAMHRYALELHPDDADALGLGPGSSISVDDEKDESRNGVIPSGRMLQPLHNN